MRCSLRADGTVGKEGIKVLQKKLNRKVFKITGMEGKSARMGKTVSDEKKGN